MDAAKFEATLRGKSDTLKNWTNLFLPGKAGEIYVRFINQNFIDQGWHGPSFVGWDAIKRKGRILYKSGVLMRGTSFVTSYGQVVVFNDVPYARVHNDGFIGTQNVGAYTRQRVSTVRGMTGRTLISGLPEIQRIQKASGPIEVRAHTRQMNIKRRHFMPTVWNESPIPVDEMRAEVINFLKQTFS